MRYKLLVITSMFLMGTVGLRGQVYDFKTPYKRYTLPEELREISDITILNNSTLACVQDELGIIYTYSLIKNAIIQRDSFYLAGDYEGIARDNKFIYILRSDGLILKVKPVNHTIILVDSVKTGVPAANNEGLCYDKSQHDLLIASKSRSNIGGREFRCIYRFDLDQNKLQNDPYLEINNTDIQNHLIINGLHDTLAKKIRFKPSGITIHARSKKLYVLSATAKLLCIYNEKKLEDVIQLDPVIFNKAEGICFNSKGDLIISNEGQTGLPSIIILKPAMFHKKRKGT